MLHDSSYDRFVTIFKYVPVLVPLFMVVSGVLVRVGAGDRQFYIGDWLFLLITAAYIILSATTYLYHRRAKQSAVVDTAALIASHVLAGAFMLFVSGFLSVFLAAWVLLMVSADMRFGIRGFWISFGGLCLTALSAIALHPTMDLGDRLVVAECALAVGAVGYIIAQIRAAAANERIRLDKSREEEQYQRERLMALVNSMGDAVVATDEAGVIRVYNSTLLNMLDTNLDLTGKSITELLNLQDESNARVNLIKDLNKSKTMVRRTDLRLVFNDGDAIKLYVNVAPILPGYRSRAERGFIFILRDITKEKSLEEERDEFVSVVSHELRTPVTIAEGNLSNMLLMIDHNSDTKTLRNAANDAHEHIVYLAKLVNDLATLAKAERGTAGEPETIDLSVLLHDQYTTYLPQAQAKNLALNVDVAPKLGSVIVNKLYLQEIVQNLITNALKYTSKGSVTLRGTRTAEFVAISIADTGIGISMSDQKKIFQKFYRSEDYRTRESSGTGLGLYVCKRLAEKIGASITCVSRLNHGSTFTIIMPVETDGQTVRGTPKPDDRRAATSESVSPKPDSTHSAPSN